VPLPNPVQKRKADGDLQRTNHKLVRRDQPIATSSTTLIQNKKTSNVPPTAAGFKSNTTASAPSRVNPSNPSNGIGPSTASTVEPAKVPKKGSYAEILARAKAAQATLGQVGKIQHKRIEKSLSKRERQELKEQESQSHRLSKKSSRSDVRKPAREGRNGARQTSGKVSSKAPALPDKKVKKAALATTGYTGTARPNPAAAQSSKPTASSRATGKDGYGRSSSSRRDTYASEDEEDDDDDDEEDYYSDASSDMEAAAFEVDEEEERAARIARKEDEEALREEARLKREKEEKRRRLAALAKVKR
jgi:protein SPT2